MSRGGEKGEEEEEEEDAIEMRYRSLGQELGNGKRRKERTLLGKRERVCEEEERRGERRQIGIGAVETTSIG